MNNRLPRHVGALLAELGAPKEYHPYRGGSKRRGCFWRRYAHCLEEIHIDFKKIYLRRIKNLHPDRDPQQAKNCARLNELWQRITLLFERRIDPLWRQRRRLLK